MTISQEMPSRSERSLAPVLPADWRSDADGDRRKGSAHSLVRYEFGVSHFAKPNLRRIGVNYLHLFAKSTHVPGGRTAGRGGKARLKAAEEDRL
jgi:hypothetical protein